MQIDLDLSDVAADMELLAATLINVEEGDGADGVGHGKLRPPSEDLLQEDGESPAEG